MPRQIALPVPSSRCSSNVVEKCLKLGGAGLNEQRDAVVVELMESPQLGRLLQVGLCPLWVVWAGGCVWRGAEQMPDLV